MSSRVSSPSVSRASGKRQLAALESTTARLTPAVRWGRPGACRRNLTLRRATAGHRLVACHVQAQLAAAAIHASNRAWREARSQRPGGYFCLTSGWCRARRPTLEGVRCPVSALVSAGASSGTLEAGTAELLDVAATAVPANAASPRRLTRRAFAPGTPGSCLTRDAGPFLRDEGVPAAPACVGLGPSLLKHQSTVQHGALSGVHAAAADRPKVTREPSLHARSCGFLSVCRRDVASVFHRRRSR